MGPERLFSERSLQLNKRISKSQKAATTVLNTVRGNFVCTLSFQLAFGVFYEMFFLVCSLRNSCCYKPRIPYRPQTPTSDSNNNTLNNY